jgi:hypothetical protein
MTLLLTLLGSTTEDWKVDDNGGAAGCCAENILFWSHRIHNEKILGRE